METQKQADERILAKIKKCMALSESSNEHEAAAALRQAQKLMEEYGVTQSGLLRAEIGECQVKSRAASKLVSPWENALVWTVANAFGCKVLWRAAVGRQFGEMFGTFILVGQKQQVMVAEYTLTVLQRQLMKARAKYVASLPGYYSGKEKTKAGNGFCFGWVNAVQKHVHKMAMGDDMVLAIQSYVEERSKGGEAKKRKADINHSAYYDGQRAGAEVSLHRPMNGAAERLMIGSK